MSRITVVAVLSTLVPVALSLAACKKKEGAAGDDCAAAVDHMMNVQMADLPKDMDAKTRSQITTAMTTAKANLTASCRQTKWSKEAIDCVKAIKSDEDANKCDEKLTKEQREAADKAADVDPGVAVEKPDGAGAGSAADGSAAPAAGSAAATGSAAPTGSAAAGSAAAGSAAAGSAATAGAAAAGAAAGSGSAK